MSVLKYKSAGLLLGAAAVCAGTLFTYKRVRDFKEHVEDINSIPWDVDPSHTSWKRLLKRKMEFGHERFREAGRND